MGMLSWILLGLVVGFLAKYVMPGKAPGGCIATTLLGIAGGMLGGFLATRLGFGGVVGFDLRSLVVAFLGAVLLLLLLNLWRGRTTPKS